MPERPEEVTTEGGLDVVRHGERIAEVAEQLKAAGIEVSLFVDPDLRADPGHPRSRRGFEINTDAYTRARDQAEAMVQLDKVARAATLGRGQGLHLYAGHGLRTDNVGPVASLPGMEELNIGHFLDLARRAGGDGCGGAGDAGGDGPPRQRSRSDITPVAVTSGPAPGPEMVSGSSQ